MKRYLIAVAVVVAMWLIAGYAHAAPVVIDPEAGWDKFLAALMELVKGKNWVPFVGVVVLLVVKVIRKEGGWIVAKIPWLGTRWGGWCLAAVLAAFPALGQGLVSGLGWRSVIREAVLALAVAVAGWEFVKDKAKSNPSASPNSSPPV